MKPATTLSAVTPLLHGWAAFHTAWKVSFNSYAYKTANGIVLIDPTRPVPAVRKKIDDLGDLIAITLTNAHHDRDADWFRKEYGIQIYAHEAAHADCDIKIDVPVVDGEKLPSGLRTIFLPGVSPSEMALLGDGVLLLGDAILNTPGKGLELLPDQFIEDKKQARRSLRKLLDFSFKVVTFGHGKPITENGKKTIANFLKPHRPIQSSSGKAR